MPETEWHSKMMDALRRAFTALDCAGGFLAVAPQYEGAHDYEEELDDLLRRVQLLTRAISTEV